MLIMPPFTQTKRAMKRCLFPLGIGYLAAVLEDKGILVETLDCIVEGYEEETYHDDGEMTFGLKDSDIEKRIQDFKPGFVGVSCLISRQIHNAYKICKITKQVDSKIQTIIGGCHPSALPNHVIDKPEIDHVVIGDGENAILRYL